MTNAQPSAATLEWTRGDRLYKSLRQTGVSHGEMAEILGVSRNTIGNYIADRTPITDGYLRLWAMRTGVPFEELKHGTPVSPNSPEPGTRVTAPYRALHKSHNGDAKVTPIGGTVSTTPAEEGSGDRPQRKAA